MSNKVIVHENPLGMTICNPAPEMFDRDSPTRMLLRQQGIDFMTDEEVIAWIKAKDVPSDVNSLVIERDHLPDDTYFTVAWEINDHAVKVNMDKARPHWMNHLRDLRAKKFIELGFPNRINPQVEEAILDAPTKKMLKDLRDIPQTYDLSSAMDVDQLKTMIPDILK